MPSPRSRVHAIGAGALEVRGEGPQAELVAAHLGPEVAGRPVWVVVDLVDGASTSVEDGDDPVRLTCAPQLRSMAPVLDAIRAAAARRDATVESGVAFGWDGRVVVAEGPPGSGKTAVLLRAIERGATAVAPETCWVDADGRVRPLPQPLRVRPHHRRSPALAGALSPLERWRLAAGGLLPGRWARRTFVDVPLVRLGSPPEGWRLAGRVEVGARDADAVVDEAARLAR